MCLNNFIGSVNSNVILGKGKELWCRGITLGEGEMIIMIVDTRVNIQNFGNNASVISSN